MHWEELGTFANLEDLMDCAVHTAWMSLLAAAGPLAA